MRIRLVFRALLVGSLTTAAFLTLVGKGEGVQKGQDAQKPNEQLKSSQETPPGAQLAERLVIKFENGSFELLSRVSVHMILPPSDELGEGPRSGFWFEVRSVSDEFDEVTYRRIMGNPLRLAFEGPDIDTEGTVPDRKEAILQQQVFTILIPSAAPGDRLVIFSSPLVLGREAEPAQEIAQIDLTTIPLTTIPER